MLEARILEEKLAVLYRSGKIVGGVFLGRGQEALSVSLGIHLRRGDVYAPLIRDQAGRMAFGDTILDTMRTYLGSSLGSMRGRDGNIHRGRPSEGYHAMISHLGAMVSTVCGGLMAKRFRGETGAVGGTCIGEGGTSTGSFHEGMNLAGVEKLPIVVVVANNQFSYSTPNDRQFACNDLLVRAEGYGVRGRRAVGNDLMDCLSVIGEAVSAARSGEGPQLVVADLLRLVGHGEHDDASYIPAAMKESSLGGDCLDLARTTLLEKGWLTGEEAADWQKIVEKEVEETSSKVLREPSPDPSEEDWNAFSCLDSQQNSRYPEERQ
ncbi:MAG: thiamine pyrophosphate-dependent dehydrogenase E1 component subunit alpha [Verrucomicrobia bacterium]|jgi:pyruvate dehydrogenase E1 component alpha subunit/2-oxoisovalerate dehydrogenase E1 component alpha subunit|nr:MAG: thiamine pyrophosphate-dependent dehydrogenase E1 component subunit alpha [Verrucomicrobiota bacterium]